MLRTLLLGALAVVPALGADSTASAAKAINALGLDLLHRQPADASALLSPWSIQLAMAMTYEGSVGDTRTEMTKVLHYSDEKIGASFAALQGQLDGKIKELLDSLAAAGLKDNPIRLDVANRLFSKKGLPFKKSYFDLLGERYGAAPEALDFGKDPRGSAAKINSWVAKQTQNRIRDLVDAGDFNELTSLVVVNAIYLKAGWQEPFEKDATKPLPFMLGDGKSVSVPTMRNAQEVGYEKYKDYTAISLPYSFGELQFLVLLPDKVDGLPTLESALDEQTLAGFTHLPPTFAAVFLPRFKMEPPALRLGGDLEALGMKHAFNIPPGSADFSGITPVPIFISEVLHKAFLSVNEAGTEAAAASAVMMMLGAAPPEKPVEVRVDRPFLFAIQHVPSGACLFLGRMTDPR